MQFLQTHRRLAVGLFLIFFLALLAVCVDNASGHK